MAARKAIKPKYKNAAELRAACEDYFKNLGVEEPPTQSGLVIHIGMSSERRFREQAERKDPDFAEVVDWCRTKIASWHETQVAKLAPNSLHWLRKNRPEEWGEDQSGALVSVNLPAPPIISFVKPGPLPDDDG